jgi:hypothetical protein
LDTLKAKGHKAQDQIANWKQSLELQIQNLEASTTWETNSMEASRKLVGMSG